MSQFDAYYYANCCGRPYARDEHWLKFFGGIADRIVTDIAPGTVLDAGCAMGMLVEALRERGVDARGIDISSYAIERVSESVKPYCRQGSIAEPFSDRFDLIVCIEVVEHMPADEADRALANFCAHADDVLFSSSPNDHREPTHVNVRPVEDWAERFAKHGFVRDVDFDAGFISPWALRLRKTTAPIHRIVREYERRLARLEHERHDMRAFTAEAQNKQAAAEQLLAHTREVLHDEIEGLRKQVEPLRHTADKAEAAARAHSDRAAAAEQTIKNMEQSLFWRLRRLFRR
jgi:2-polyprenyl-3-methyl-5-hydroxy-6-metoxy-1,4-benzoquinol methylase